MDNIMNRRMWILSSWQFVFSIAIVVMITSRMASANSVNISQHHGRCSQDFSYGDFCEVSCNSYTGIPTDIKIPKSVIILDMGDNNTIKTLTNGSMIRSKLISLQILNLEYCKIREVEPCAFAGSSEELAHIYLNNNLITVLNPDVFTDVKNLEVLYIDNNPIIFQPGKIFPNLPKLATLDLNNCRLESIPANFFDNLENLQSLNLSGNPLKQSNWETLRIRSNLISLNLEGTPLQCNCYAKFLLETLQLFSITRPTFENMTCELDNKPNVKNDLSHEGNGENMTCHSEKLGLPHNHHSLKSNLKPNRHKHVMALGEDIFFECRYRGISIPSFQLNKPNRSTRNVMDDLLQLHHISRSQRHTGMTSVTTDSKPSTSLNRDNKSSMESTTPVTTTTYRPNSLEHYYNEIFNKKVGEILVVLRNKVKDKGTYTCFLFHKHGPALKLVGSGPSTPDTTLAVWKWITIVVGLILVVSVVAVTVVSWVKRGKLGEGGITQRSTFALGEFDTKSTNNLLTDASRV